MHQPWGLRQHSCIFAGRQAIGHRSQRWNRSHYGTLRFASLELFLRGHRDQVRQVEAHPKRPNNLLTVSSDGSIGSWDLENAEMISEYDLDICPLWRSFALVQMGNRFAVRTAGGGISLVSSCDREASRTFPCE